MTRIAHQMNRGPRETLEDAVRAAVVEMAAPKKGAMSILCVLDGVGGNVHGEVASGRSADVLIDRLLLFCAKGQHSRPDGTCAPDAYPDALSAALKAANEEVLRLGSEVDELRGMATTVVCATVGEAGLHVAWAGDSRCYLYSGSVLRQVTQDHSEVERLVDLGLISREDAKVHPLRHTITRYLGQAEGFAPDTVHHALSSGDVVILSTDGLTDVVSDRAMAEEIGSYHAGRFRFEELPDRLVERALQAGTHDNVTVLVCGYKIDVPSSKTMTGAYPVALSGVFRSLSEEE